MEKIIFSQYTPDYISGVMSLRKPQEESIKILDNIIKETNLINSNNIEKSKQIINEKYPIFTDFERNFISLTFALATGVGKTRLMGAFISYLYTNYGIKNFLVVAPSTTIYEKLKKDFGNPDTSKYVFNGLGCFNNPPKVVDDDNFNRNISLFESDITIYVYNISKFDKDNTKMKSYSEVLGMSFYDQLSSMDDLVIIMDESHHYRADKGMETINNLKPVLGLELTATPFVNVKSKQVPFKNVVYEYSLAKAIADGYTRVPYAVTRTDINYFDFGDDAKDKLMINDGITCHKMIKEKLNNYSFLTKKKKVKPFMMIVCKDIEHAKKVETYIKSEEFEKGFYKNKVITINSKMKGAESDINTQALLGVEDINNPIEIVIHVNMLKEGWDVNNLFTIVPLRTATSKILREQMVGRGLRLPYGERTGEKEIDSVLLTAHDKFDELIREAQQGNSIFNNKNIIDISELENRKTKITQLSLEYPENIDLANQIINDDEQKKNGLSNHIAKLVVKKVEEKIVETNNNITEEVKSLIKEEIKKEISDITDLGDIYYQNKEPIETWIKSNIDVVKKEINNKFISIPRIKTEKEDGEYYFENFDVYLKNFNHKPIESDILIKNLIDSGDEEIVEAGYINFEATNPKKVIVDLLRNKPEIDYEKNNELLYKLISSVTEYYEKSYGVEGMKNIVMMYKKDIVNEIHKQLINHFVRNEGIIKEEVFSDRNYNLKSEYNYSIIKNIFDLYSSDRDGKITSILFDGIKSGVFSETKFDSEPELTLARKLESDKDYVITWLRPNINEFDITYNYGKRYEPDFVVETKDKIYLVEVKADKDLTNDDVVGKKKEAIKYCKTVSEYDGVLEIKDWQYVLIPASKINNNSTIKHLFKTYSEE